MLLLDVETTVKLHTLSNRVMSEQQLLCTFLHVALQHGSVSEDERVEDSLAGSVEGPVQADVTAGLSVTAVLAVNVAMDPGEQQVQAGLHSAAGGGTTVRTTAGWTRLPLCFLQQNELTAQG